MHNKALYIMLKQMGGNSLYVDFITKNTNNIRLDIDEDEKITAILNKYLDNIKTLVCLDFHGVTDLFDDNEKYHYIYQNVLFHILVVIQKQF